ncbi:hypothetical protein B0H63DRAFT_172340 [Podospora didyma]|uniref:Uncharacterized protein n=1 Tax=Podospora didyma TaxID=330526 RepID=A0AAE0TZ01_9PEZI|nr:hypothetical protein B0H63DRAFT_172340 [Podospora didyma]
MREENHKTKSLHPRRSLDQFFYSSLPETISGDHDQVVYKNTVNAPGGQMMIMVDQLWQWLLDSSHSEAQPAIFTCFPQKDAENGTNSEGVDDTADLRRAIIDDINDRLSDENSPRIAEGTNVAGVIIERAVNVMLSVRNVQSLDFWDIFRDAVGQAAEQQTKFFRLFQNKLESETGCISDSTTKRDGVKLALEIADIIDELNSISRLFEAQIDVLDTAINALSTRDERFAKLRETLIDIVTQDITGYKKQVKRMTEDAQRTKDSLMDLLDLEQKEESLEEAHYSNEEADTAREQADETADQSQILFLFTIVTIIFLSLPFFTSYFGMNVKEFTGDEGNTDQRFIWTIMGPLPGAVIAGLLGVAFYMYRKTRTKHMMRKRNRRLGNKPANGVSTGLL